MTEKVDYRKPKTDMSVPSVKDWKQIKQPNMTFCGVHLHILYYCLTAVQGWHTGLWTVCTGCAGMAHRAVNCLKSAAKTSWLVLGACVPWLLHAYVEWIHSRTWQKIQAEVLLNLCTVASSTECSTDSAQLAQPVSHLWLKQSRQGGAHFSRFQFIGTAQTPPRCLMNEVSACYVAWIVVSHSCTVPIILPACRFSIRVMFCLCSHFDVQYIKLHSEEISLWLSLSCRRFSGDCKSTCQFTQQSNHQKVSSLTWWNLWFFSCCHLVSVVIVSPLCLLLNSQSLWESKFWLSSSRIYPNRKLKDVLLRLSSPST